MLDPKTPFFFQWNETINSTEERRKNSSTFYTSTWSDFIHFHTTPTRMQNNLQLKIQFRFLALPPPPLPALLVDGFGADDPPPRNLLIISLMSGISPPSFGSCRFSISFLVSGSLMIFGSSTRRIKGRIIMRTIGEKRKSVIFHCSRCWKYLKVVSAFSFSG